jgi:alpha-galactosidase
MKIHQSLLIIVALALAPAAFADDAGEILTPPPPATPQINGPKVYGERPGHPFLYTIPTTGDRPVTFAADGLPDGLKLDNATGRISGVVAQADAGSYDVTLHAHNDKGDDEKHLKIVIGDQICLTPAMGWNSWNVWRGEVDQGKVMAAAQAMSDTGLINHGWTYVNIDDTWQGVRGGPLNAIQPNDKFPDMKKLCDGIHALGLKAGIYSTPWETSYAGHCGGTADTPDGAWKPFVGNKKGMLNKKILPFAVGKYHFMKPDAQQWAEWGFDYLKYDWNPIEPPDVKEMSDALKASGRDFVFSLSNSAPFVNAASWAQNSNAWRTTGDIRDDWKHITRFEAQDKWAPFAGPGHFNDPDMLEIGAVTGPKGPRPSQLTPDEQYTHISAWCLLSSPLLLGNDMSKMDAFTLSLITNDEVLAVDQDTLAKQAVIVSRDDNSLVMSKPLDDGSLAVGLFNIGDSAGQVTISWDKLKITDKQVVRDLWRQKDLGVFTDQFQADVASHGVVLVKITPSK